MTTIELAEEQAHWRKSWKTSGYLTEPEIEELLKLEFADVPLSVPQQLRRYYLKLKVERPAKATQLWNAIPRTYKRRVTSKKAVKRLCAILYKFWNGFVIQFGRRTYSVSRNQFYRIH